MKRTRFASAAGFLATALLSLAGPNSTLAQDGGGVTLNQYRAAPTTRDGYAVSRAIGLGHAEFGARLDVDYAYQPLRVIGTPDEDILVDHQVSGQLGLALGLLDRFVGWVRLPVTFVMDGTGVAGDPVAQAVALGDVTLGARWVLFGENEDEEVLGVALATEAALPTAEGADASQDLAGEMGPSFAPELDVELRFAPVRIRAELGLRFREPARYQRLPVGNELFWGAGVDVDIAPGVIEASVEVFGATPLDDFARQRRSPIEALLGARVHPGAGLTVHAGVGAGLGNGYGAPRVRALLGVGWVSDFDVPSPVREADRAGREAADGQDEIGEGASDDHDASDEPSDATRDDEAAPEDTRPAGTATAPSIDLDAAYANLDRDGDRIVDAHDRCPLDREDYDEIQDDDGCPEEDADEDRVADVSDMCPLTPGVANDDASCHGCPELACVSDEGTITISERVEFATGSDRILEQSEDVLEAVRSILDTNPQIVGIRIEGHTDDRDSDRRNLTLSSNRAASVRSWLVEHGLDVARFQAWGCGEAHPVENNRTRRGRQANRRVEFHIVDPPTAGFTPREGCQQAE
ncbi:MAG: OmpA family protein [Sandaracinaceae bacterium]